MCVCMCVYVHVCLCVYARVCMHVCVSAAEEGSQLRGAN